MTEDEFKKDEIGRLKKQFTETEAANERRASDAWMKLTERFRSDMKNLIEENVSLNVAFHDAINSPKGTIPKSGEQFYNSKIMGVILKE